MVLVEPPNDNLPKTFGGVAYGRAGAGFGICNGMGAEGVQPRAAGRDSVDRDRSQRRRGAHLADRPWRFTWV